MAAQQAQEMLIIDAAARAHEEEQQALQDFAERRESTTADLVATHALCEDLERQRRQEQEDHSRKVARDKRQLEKTAEAVNNKKLQGIRDLRDESGRAGMRVVFELKRDAHPETVLANLFKSTRLQASFPANLVAVDCIRDENGVEDPDRKAPVRLTLRSALERWMRFRFDCVRRRASYEEARAAARLHIVEGLVLAQAAADGRGAALAVEKAQHAGVRKQLAFAEEGLASAVAESQRLQGDADRVRRCRLLLPRGLDARDGEGVRRPRPPVPRRRGRARARDARVLHVGRERRGRAVRAGQVAAARCRVLVAGRRRPRVDGQRVARRAREPQPLRPRADAGPDGRLYVVGGGPDGTREWKTMEALDPRTDSWQTDLAQLQTGRHYNAGAFGPDGLPRRPALSCAWWEAIEATGTEATADLNSRRNRTTVRDGLLWRRRRVMVFGRVPTVW